MADSILPYGHVQAYDNLCIREHIRIHFIILFKSKPYRIRFTFILAKSGIFTFQKRKGTALHSHEF